MELKIILDDEKELWESAVGQCKGATVFHSWEWLKLSERYSKKKVLGRTFQAKLYPLLISENGSVIGLFPVFLYTIPFFRVVASPPSGVENLYLGPLFCMKENISRGNHERQLMNFLELTDTFIKKTLQPAMTLLHTAPSGVVDMRSFKWAGYDVEPRYTYEVDLTIGKTNIWNGFSKGLRHSITKAKRIGISTEEGSMEDLGFIYDLLRENRHIHAEKQFITDIFYNFSPRYLKVFIAKREGLPISGIAAIVYREKVMFWIGAPKCSVEGISPNELVMWDCMCWAIDNGYTVFELMGADDLRLVQFKGKFNGLPKLYFTIRRFSPVVKIFESLYRIIKPRYTI